MSNDKFDAFSQQDRAFGGPGAYENQGARLPSEEPMSSDLVKSLRARGLDAEADRIEALEAEVERFCSLLEGADQEVLERLLKAEARAELLRAVVDRLDLLINKDNEEAKALIRAILKVDNQ